MGFELRSHTADVAVEATGPTLGEAFAATADGMATAMCEKWPPGGSRFDVTVSAEREKSLLFDYLDDLIYQRDVQDVLPVDNEGRITSTDEQWRFEGSYRGIPLDAVDGRDLKAVTYADMEIEERDEDWQLYVVLDV